VNCKTAVYKVKTFWEKWGRGTRGTQNMGMCELMITNHKNICIGIIWNDVGVLSYDLKNYNRREGLYDFFETSEPGKVFILGYKCMCWHFLPKEDCLIRVCYGKESFSWIVFLKCSGHLAPST
jgi:hypothetical protein